MLRRDKVRLIFLLKNFLKGMLFFAVALAFYKITFSYLDLSSLKEQVSLDLPSIFVFILFFMSELILGLIPPELFMIWAITSRPITSYFIYVFFSFHLSLVFFGIRVWGSLCFIEIQSLCFSWPFLLSVPRLYVYT